MTIVTCPKEYVDFAHTLADKSEKIILKYFRSEINVESKNDDTPVTVADKESESLIRELIIKKYLSRFIIKYSS